MCRFSVYKRKIFTLITACLLSVSACLVILCNTGARSVCSADISGATQPRAVGYLPNWSYQGYKDIDLSALTHLNIAFCNVNSNGEISSGIPDGEMRAIVDKAHASGVKVMAALGGGGYGEPYRDLIKNASAIQSLNAKITVFCEKYNLDGIDLDIELGSGDAVWKNYGAWVSDLRTICDRHGWHLSTATAQWVAYDVTPQTFSLFDFINVMAYDNDSYGSDSHSSYQFAVECLNYFNTIKNVPKEKLVLGVPFYGRGYDDSGALDWNSYKSFSDLVAIDAANFNLDRYGDVAYTGAQTMREKCALAKNYGGIMIWELTLDAEGEYSLLGVIKEELLSSLLPVPDDNVGENGGLYGGKSYELYIVIPIVSVAAVAGIAVVLAFMLKKRKTK